MAIYLSVQYNDGFLPNIIQSTQGYYLRGTQLKSWKNTLLRGHAMFRGTRPLPSVFDDNHRPLGSSGVLCGSPLAPYVSP